MSEQPAETPAEPMSVDTSIETTPSNKVETTTTPSSGRSSGRVRKTTQVFTYEDKADDTEDFTPPQGKGVKLSEIAYVKTNVEALNKKHTDMLRQLYVVLYGRRFQQKHLKVVKEQILEFSGIPEQDQDEKSREHLIARMGKWKLVFVREMMDLLAVDRSSKSFTDEGKTAVKEAMLDRLIDWLYDPQETKIATKKAATAEKSEKKQARKKAARAKAKEKKEAGPAKKKRKTTAKKAAAVEDDDDEEEEQEDSESEGQESSSDFEESKKKKSTQKKRKVTRRPKKAQPEESDDNEADDDAAEAEKDEEQPAAEPEEEKSAVEPLAEEVCDKVRDIIAHGNSEELTVKKIVRQLSADLGRDMTSQKKAIKEFITNDQTA